jgi:dCTP deaminase
MLRDKHYANGVSHGLSEAGYDIRIKQEVSFLGPSASRDARIVMTLDGSLYAKTYGRFVLASAVEEFDMPDNLVGIVHDKSTWARRGLSVFNTVIEPGWRGFLTLELVYHGEGDLVIPAGSGIAQVIFTRTATRALYDGRYQNQPDQPTPAIEAKP